MAAMRLSPETRRQLSNDDRRWPIKLGMRAIVIPLAFIAMILFAVATSLTRQDFGGNDWTDAFPLAPVLLALFYNPLVLFLTLIHRHGRSIHPGWHVGVDLFIWGLGVPAVLFSIGDGWFWYWQRVIEIDGIVLCENWYGLSQDCNPLVQTLGQVEIAANVFLAIITLIHLTLFVFACIATHKYRKARRQGATERRNIELQYNRSPELHRQSQPPAYSQTPDVNEHAGAVKYA